VSNPCLAAAFSMFLKPREHPWQTRRCFPNDEHGKSRLQYLQFFKPSTATTGIVNKSRYEGLHWPLLLSMLEQKTEDREATMCVCSSVQTYGTTSHSSMTTAICMTKYNLRMLFGTDERNKFAHIDVIDVKTPYMQHTCPFDITWCLLGMTHLATHKIMGALSQYERGASTVRTSLQQTNAHLKDTNFEKTPPRLRWPRNLGTRHERASGANKRTLISETNALQQDDIPVHESLHCFHLNNCISNSNDCSRKLVC
jgi:hypothetical protein